METLSPAAVTHRGGREGETQPGETESQGERDRERLREKETDRERLRGAERQEGKRKEKQQSGGRGRKRWRNADPTSELLTTMAARLESVKTGCQPYGLY